MNKKEILEYVSNKFDELEGINEDEFDIYFQLTNYAPSNSKYDFFEYLIEGNSHNISKLKFSDFSRLRPIKSDFYTEHGVKFKCDMGYEDCEERGYCNGDC